MAAGPILDGAHEGWHTPVPAAHPALRLLTAGAVRERCRKIMAAAERGQTRHIAWHPECLPQTADYVATTIRQRYPDLDVPYHSRWRHFEAGGVDRWAVLAATLPADRAERGRARIDLAIVSVLLDAGAGADWRYADAATGMTLARSEGLGVASLRMFAAGAFAAIPRHPLAADAGALARLEHGDAGRRAFRRARAIRLVGLEGRAALLRRLGRGGGGDAGACSVRRRGSGNLFDYLAAHAPGGESAPRCCSPRCCAHWGRCGRRA